MLDLTITIWEIPHKGHAELVEIDTGLVAEGMPGGLVQAPKILDLWHAEFDREQPYRVFVVSTKQAQQLAQQIQDTHIQMLPSHLLRDDHITKHHGGHRGIRVCCEHFETTQAWRAPDEHSNEALDALYASVLQLSKQ
jgi:hypothetical protein